jgi:hypothetical protein
VRVITNSVFGYFSFVHIAQFWRAARLNRTDTVAERKDKCCTVVLKIISAWKTEKAKLIKREPIECIRVYVCVCVCVCVCVRKKERRASVHPVFWRLSFNARVCCKSGRQGTGNGYTITRGHGLRRGLIWPRTGYP